MFRKHPQDMSWNDCTTGFWKGLRKHSLCKCCLLPAWSLTPAHGLNVNFGYNKHRSAGAQKWKSSSPNHELEIFLDGPFTKKVLCLDIVLLCFVLEELTFTPMSSHVKANSAGETVGVMGLKIAGRVHAFLCMLPWCCDTRGNLV